MHARVGKRPLIIKYRTAEEERRHYCYGLNHQKSSRAWHYGARVSRTYVLSSSSRLVYFVAHVRSGFQRQYVCVVLTYRRSSTPSRSRTGPVRCRRPRTNYHGRSLSTPRDDHGGRPERMQGHVTPRLHVASRLDSVSRRRLQLTLVVVVVRWLLGARWTGCCCWCFPPGPCTIPMWRDVSRRAGGTLPHLFLTGTPAGEANHRHWRVSD